MTSWGDRRVRRRAERDSSQESCGLRGVAVAFFLDLGAIDDRVLLLPGGPVVCEALGEHFLRFGGAPSVFPCPLLPTLLPCVSSVRLGTLQGWTAVCACS